MPDDGRYERKLRLQIANARGELGPSLGEDLRIDPAWAAWAARLLTVTKAAEELVEALLAGGIDRRAEVPSPPRNAIDAAWLALLAALEEK